jgi:hypothetical protein
MKLFIVRRIQVTLFWSLNESLHRGVVIPVCSAVVFTTGSASSLFTLFMNFALFCHTTLFPISQDSECLSKSSPVVHYPLQLTWPNEANNDLFQPYHIIFIHLLITLAENWFGSHVMHVINIECTFDSQSDNSTSLSLVNYPKRAFIVGWQIFHGGYSTVLIH